MTLSASLGGAIGTAETHRPQSASTILAARGRGRATRRLTGRHRTQSLMCCSTVQDNCGCGWVIYYAMHVSKVQNVDELASSALNATLHLRVTCLTTVWQLEYYGSSLVGRPEYICLYEEYYEA